MDANAKISLLTKLRYLTSISSLACWRLISVSSLTRSRKSVLIVIFKTQKIKAWISLPFTLRRTVAILRLPFWSWSFFLFPPWRFLLRKDRLRDRSAPFSLVPYFFEHQAFLELHNQSFSSDRALRRHRSLQ